MDGDRIEEYRKALNWPSKKLARELGISPLTLQRYEKKAKEGTSQRIPRYLELALAYLLLREGKSSTKRVITRIALPDVAGALLPMIGHKKKYFEGYGLDVSINRCDTGTEALDKIYGGHADVAGAARGLLERYKAEIVDVGIILESRAAFELLFVEEPNVNLSDFLGQSLAGFADAEIICPKGSDLTNLLEQVREICSPEPTIHEVKRQEAIDKFIARASEIAVRAKKSMTSRRSQSSQKAGGNLERRLMYIAWDPITRRVKEKVDEHLVEARFQHVKTDSFPLINKALEKNLFYEFHLCCSRRWFEENPSAAFGLLCGLALAQSDYENSPFMYLQDLWELYELKKDENDVKKDLKRYDVVFKPSSDFIRRLGKKNGTQNITVINYRDLKNTSVADN